MSEMVERVARAIADADMEDYEGREALYNAFARAAIEAMREPTNNMRGIGFDEAYEHIEPSPYGPVVHAKIGQKVWQAMIDAALREE